MEHNKEVKFEKKELMCIKEAVGSDTCRVHEHEFRDDSHGGGWW
jgi:hypothetical protein